MATGHTRLQGAPVPTSVAPTAMPAHPSSTSDAGPTPSAPLVPSSDVDNEVGVVVQVASTRVQVAWMKLGAGSQASPIATDWVHAREVVLVPPIDIGAGAHAHAHAHAQIGGDESPRTESLVRGQGERMC